MNFYLNLCNAQSINWRPIYTSRHIFFHRIASTGVNLINILWVHLHWYFCSKKLQSQNVTREKLFKALLYKKFTRKMLMKLTPDGRCFTSELEPLQILLILIHSVSVIYSRLSVNLCRERFHLPASDVIKGKAVCVWRIQNLNSYKSPMCWKNFLSPFVLRNLIYVWNIKY